MDFNIQRDDLLRALTRVQGIVEKRSPVPILTCVLVQATPEGVRFTATDKSMTFLGDFQAVVQAPGEIAIDAAHFFSVARVLPEPTVRIRGVDAGRIEVKSGSSVFKLASLSASDFPVTPPIDQSRTLRLQAGHLRKLITQTLFSVAPDDNRYGLCGAHVEDVPTVGEGGVSTPMLRMVSTDGSRLSWSQVPYEGELAVSRRTLLPRKALAEMLKLLEGADEVVELSFGDRAALLRMVGSQLHMRLLEADFPDYRQVLPASWKRRLLVHRDDFGEALRRVAIFATDKSRSVRFAFGADSIVLTTSEADVGDAREEYRTELQGEPISIGFNARYVQDVLAACPDGRVIFELGDALAPCILKCQDDPDALFVVMPIRLD